MIVAIVLSIILVLICGVRALNSIDPKRDNPLDFLSIVGVATFSILIGVLITTLINEKEEKIEIKQPTAIDVYKGRTSLRIIYEDSVATDSMVVFKERF